MKLSRNLRRLAVPSVSIFFLWLMGYGYYRHMVVLRPHVVMHSRLPCHELHVPFVFYNGNLFVQAAFGGRPRTCILDTGMAIIECPPSLCPQASYTGVFWPHFRPDSFSPPQVAA